MEHKENSTTTKGAYTTGDFIAGGSCQIDWTCSDVQASGILNLYLWYWITVEWGIKYNLKDIDGNRLQIKINKGKGAKDRVVQIPECLLHLLRVYYRRLKPRHYLFNGLKKGSKYSHRAAQWSIIRARELAGIKKTASIHTLRNCYATHHIENGTDLVFLQEQLGHSTWKPQPGM